MHLLPANGLSLAVLLILAISGGLVLPQVPWRSIELPSAATLIAWSPLIVLGLAVLAGAAIYWRRRRAARRITLTLR